MISTISRSEVVGRVSDLTRSTHLAKVRPAYHHYYTSSSHPGSVPVPVIIADHRRGGRHAGGPEGDEQQLMWG